MSLKSYVNFLYFFFLLWFLWLGLFKTMLNSSKCEHPFLVPDFRGNAFNFSPLRMFGVGLSYMAFIMLRYRRNIPQHNKSHIQLTYSKHFLQWQKIESISSKLRNKTRVSTLITTIQHTFGSPSHNNQRRKRLEKKK